MKKLTVAGFTTHRGDTKFFLTELEGRTEEYRPMMPSKAKPVHRACQLDTIFSFHLGL